MEYSEKIAELANGPYADLFKTKPKQQVATADDRLIESFNEIVSFYHNYGHIPRSDGGMKEKLLAQRLKNMKQDKNKKAMLAEYDPEGILEDDMDAPKNFKELEKNFGDLFKGAKDLFNVKVLPNNGRVKRTVENGYEATRREECLDFDAKYKDVFTDIRRKLEDGELKTAKFEDIKQLYPGGFYIYKGELSHVVSFDEIERKAGGYSQQRITVVFENKTESHMYRRSLAQRLYEDSGFVVIDKNTPEQQSLEHEVTGRIYVLKSKSTDDRIASIKDLYKIGMVETESVESRLANAKNEPTYLMADVEIVNTYRVEDYDTQKLEDMIHKFFGSAQLELEIVGKDGLLYKPREWYCVPYSVIDQAIRLISTREITDYYYDNIEQILKKK